jgi:hypothetical protein
MGRPSALTRRRGSGGGGGGGVAEDDNNNYNNNSSNDNNNNNNNSESQAMLTRSKMMRSDQRQAKLRSMPKKRLQDKVVEMHREQRLFKTALKDQRAYIQKLQEDKAQEEQKLICHQNKEQETRHALEYSHREKDCLRLKVFELDQELMVARALVPPSPSPEQENYDDGRDTSTDPILNGVSTASTNNNMDNDDNNSLLNERMKDNQQEQRSHIDGVHEFVLNTICGCV